MTDYTLTYFDIDGGRGDPIRLAFHIAGLAFEDKRIGFEQFAEIKPTLPFGVIPVLDVDGHAITQSNAILRYIGKHAGLYPSDPIQALYCDEAMDALEDTTHFVVQTFGLEGEALKRAREELAAGKLSTYLSGLEKLLLRGGGEFFADGRLTVADLKVFVQTRALRAGNLDYLPSDLVDRVAPQLVSHMARIADDPDVKRYYAKRGQTGAG